MIFLTSGSGSAVTWIGVGTGTHDDDLLEENLEEEDGEFQPHVGWMVDVLTTKSLIFCTVFILLYRKTIGIGNGPTLTPRLPCTKN